MRTGVTLIGFSMQSLFEIEFYIFKYIINMKMHFCSNCFEIFLRVIDYKFKQCRKSSCKEKNDYIYFWCASYLDFFAHIYSNRLIKTQIYFIRNCRFNRYKNHQIDNRFFIHSIKVKTPNRIKKLLKGKVIHKD